MSLTIIDKVFDEAEDSCEAIYGYRDPDFIRGYVVSRLKRELQPEMEKVFKRILEKGN